MKIIFYSKPWYADCDFPLIREFQRMGHDVYFFIDLIVLKSTLFDIRQQPRRYGILKASEIPELLKYSDYLDLEKIYILNYIRRDRYFLQHIYVYIKFLFMVLRINPDVFHFSTVLRLRESILYLLRNKMVLTVHDPFPHTGEGKGKVLFLRKMAFKIVKKFVLLNVSQKDKFCHTHHIAEKDVLVNRLGVYDTICEEKIIVDNHSTFRVLFYGRISPYKGIDYLCKAIEIAHVSNPNIECVIAGKGLFNFDISEYEKKSYFKFINRYIPNEELANLISNSDIVVCPYTDATQSGVVLQSYAFKKPVIATKVGAMGEYVINGVTGSIVPPKDERLLASEILKYSRSPELMKNITFNIQEFVKVGDASWISIMQRYLDFYKEL